ncbi:phage tail length tape measure family protein, partial [Xanthobacteraceae bacterium Astr-EGSB]|uniref:phage tail length tape measure family protein n=1 Tax=Astrobacterium formosum TaxID=3069710 RepID=UPI0027ADFC9C|nr:phage tail length tape measure family protein [Xanthobacteraceae bacterium Astr-EGSB]
MSMRLALVIDGNAAGAKQALDETARGLVNIRQVAVGAAAATGPALSAVAPAIDKASGALKGFEAELAKATGAINDMSAVGQRGLDQIRGRFDPLFAAGQRYRQELADIREAMASQALTQAQGAAAIARTKEAFASQVAALNGAKGGMGAASAATKGMSFEAKNLSFQLVDVTQGVLMGQSAFMILAQQGGQVAQVIGTSPGGLGGLMKELKTSVLGLITPMRLLGLGAVAVGAAGYGLYSSWKSSALALDDTARAAGTTIRVIRELQSVAAGKGIKADQFLPDMEQFGQQVYQARTGMGGLAEVLRANGVPAAKDFEDAFNKAADLIARAKDDQTRLALLQQMGLPASMQYVRLMQQGADGIKKSRENAVSFGDAAEEAMIRKAREFDEAWDRAWENFGKQAQRGVVVAKSGFTDLLQWWQNKIGELDPMGVLAANMRAGGGSRLTSSEADKFYNAVGRGRLSYEPARTRITVDRPTVDAAQQKADASRYQQMIGLLGQTATATEQVTAFEKQLQLAWLTTGVSIPKERTAVIKKMIEEQALGITQIKASADAQRLEADAIGMSVGQSTAYLAVQNAILDAKRRGQTLTQDNIAAIEREAAALGAAAQRTDNLKSSYDTAKGAFTTFRQEIAQG